MHTKIDWGEFLIVETEYSKLLDICEHNGLIDNQSNFILWKNEGEYAIISRGQMKEALRVYKELNSAPDDHLSTADFPRIYWDDCEYITKLFSDILLGKEHQLYHKTEKPDDGGDGRS